MKILAMAILMGLFPGVWLCAGAEEPKANIVYGAIGKRLEHKRFGMNEAHAELRGTPDKADTDGGGDYRLYVSSEVTKFQVSYTADGYYSATSTPFSNTGTHELPMVFLTPLAVENKVWADRPRFKTAMSGEVSVYRSTRTKKTRYVIKNNVATFRKKLSAAKIPKGLLESRKVAIVVIDDTLSSFSKIDEERPHRHHHATPKALVNSLVTRE